MDTVQEVSKTQNGFKTHALIMIGLLVIQYALGMVSNLFVQFPQTDQAAQQWEFARTQLSEMAHIALGMLLFLSAILFVIRAIRKHSRRWIISSIIGLLAILTAIVSGSTFISTQVDAYSLVMSLAFIVTFLAYGWNLVAGRG